MLMFICFVFFSDSDSDEPADVEVVVNFLHGSQVRQEGPINRIIA